MTPRDAARFVRICESTRGGIEERPMDYIKPAEVAATMVETGRRKLALPTYDLIIRGALAGAILGVATSLAFTGAVSTGQPLVGALIFPAGLIIIVLLGLELVTGSFALLPLPWLDRDASGAAVVTNWTWVFFANLIGSVAYGALLAIALTNMGSIERRGAHYRDRRSQNHRLRSVRRRRVRDRIRQGHPVQLDGLSRGRAGNGHELHDRQNCHVLDADLHLLRAGLRARRRQHVHYSDRHAAGRQGHMERLVAVESDSGDARQHRRRLRFYRPCHLSHLQAAASPGGLAAARAHARFRRVGRAAKGKGSH